MTLFGKILVLTNVALSVMAMVWAMLFYFERIDWTDSKEGTLTPRKARVAELWSGIRGSEASWREVHGDIIEQEGYRAADRPWYTAEVTLARTGATDMNPAHTVVYTKGVLDTEPVKNEPKHLRPKMVPAKDDLGGNLASLTSYSKVESDKRAEVIKLALKLQMLVDEDKRLTNLLKPEEGKGLRQRIEDEKVKVKHVDEELAIVGPLKVNTRIENDKVLSRDDEMRKRIKELKAALGVSDAK